MFDSIWCYHIVLLFGGFVGAWFRHIFSHDLSFLCSNHAHLRQIYTGVLGRIIPTCRYHTLYPFFTHEHEHLSIYWSILSRWSSIALDNTTTTKTPEHQAGVVLTYDGVGDMYQTCGLSPNFKLGKSHIIQWIRDTRKILAFSMPSASWRRVHMNKNTHTHNSCPLLLAFLKIWCKDCHRWARTCGVYENLIH